MFRPEGPYGMTRTVECAAFCRLERLHLQLYTNKLSAARVALDSANLTFLNRLGYTPERCNSTLKGVYKRLVATLAPLRCDNTSPQTVFNGCTYNRPF